jgi:phage terminase small subunit
MGKVFNLPQRLQRDNEFVVEYVENGGNATAAALALGVSPASASTVGHRLKHRLYDDIAEATRDLSGQAVKAIHTLQYLLEHSESDHVRLKAAKDILDRAGFKAVDKQEIVQVSSFENYTDEELKAEIRTLLSDDYGVKGQH